MFHDAFSRRETIPGRPDDALAAVAFFLALAVALTLAGAN
jgi:hypothetical protein